ncbi:MAG: hypothetical protein WC718_06405 [Phycisphaerales bacterium]|jgi:hypothetical protein
MSKNPANRNVGDHLKEGVKNIKSTYNTLYNRSGPNQMAEGVGGTVKTNLKILATGKTAANMPKVPTATRAKLGVMGAASVTPLGPVAAFANGVAKSVKQTSAAIAKQNAPKTAPGATPKLNIKSPGAPASSASAPSAPASGAKPGFAPASKPSGAMAKGPTMGARAPAAKPGGIKPAPGGTGITKKPPTV